MSIEERVKEKIKTILTTNSVNEGDINTIMILLDLLCEIVKEPVSIPMINFPKPICPDDYKITCNEPKTISTSSWPCDTLESY